MQKPKAKILTAILLTTIVLATFPLIAQASTGYIRINSTTISAVGQQVPAGGDVNLYFGGVTWSGGQFYLILSTNGFSDTTGTPYSPTFDLVNLTDPSVSTYTNALGTWDIGFNWVNGSIPLQIAGGPYFVKAFDGLSTAVAVTDTSIIVIGTFQVTPTSGPAGAALNLSGYAFGANALVNISYYNTTSPFNQIRIATNVQANALGQFNYSLTAPDLKIMVSPAGDQAYVGTPIIFNANYTAGNGYNATYTENPRGLKTIRFSNPTTIITAVNLFGNGTDFSATVAKQVGETIRLIGLNFYPGTVTVLWDGTTNIATATANSTGGFDTTITVPTATVGPHWVVLQDAGVSYYLRVSVTPTLTLTPSSGPVGTTVTAAGIGFPASVGTNVYNVTLTWTPAAPATPYIIASALTSSTGTFTTTFVVPHAAGGARSVVALANDTAATTVTTQFTVTPTLVVTPASLTNNGAIVNVYGSGLNPGVSYVADIDNHLLGMDPLNYNYLSSIFANSTGDVNIQFVAAGFSYGTHVFSLYQAGTTNLTSSQYVLFNVTLTAGDPTVDLLKSINQTVTGLSGLTGVNATMLLGINQNVLTLLTNVGVINTTVSAINAQLTSINAGVATVQTAIGTLQTSLSSIGSTISSVSGSMATISSDVGSIDTSLSSINTKVSSIDGKTATIETDLGTLQGTVTATDGKVATIQTDLGTLQADVSDLQTSVNNVPGQLSIPIWIAVVLALIAAIAAIASLLLVRRKIAG